MPREVLVLEVQGRGFRRITSRIDRATKSASALRTSLGFLRSALVVFASIRILQGFVQLADSLTLIRNRIRTVTDDVRTLNAVQARLFQLSQRTRTSFEGNATVFARFARAAGGLGITYKELLDITEGVNQAVQISGSTAQEARNALIQFAQGLSSGALQGEELRSVAEQIPRLAEAIGREFGISAGQLIAFNRANPGVFITERVVRALRNELPRLNKEFKAINVTIAQAFERLNNALIIFVGNSNKAVGVTRLIARGLTTLADNLDKVVLALLAVGSIIVFNVLADQISRVTTTILLLTRVALSPLLNILKIIRFVALTAAGALALLSFPVVGISVITLIGLFFAFRTEIESFIKSAGGFEAILKRIGNAIIATFNFLSDGLNVLALNEFLGDFTLGLLTSLTDTFGTIASKIVTFIEIVFDDVSKTFTDQFSQIKATLTNFFADIINSVLKNLRGPIKIDGKELFTIDFSSLQVTGVKVPQAAESITDALKRVASSAKNVAKALATGQIGGPILTQSQEMKDALAGLNFMLVRFDEESKRVAKDNPLGKAFESIKDSIKSVISFIKQLTGAGTVDTKALNQIIPLRGGESNFNIFQKQLNKLMSTTSNLAKTYLAASKALDVLIGSIKAGVINGDRAAVIMTRLLRTATGVGNAAAVFKDQQMLLNAALSLGAINAEEYDNQLRKIRITFLESQRDFTSGVSLFFNKYIEDATNTAKNVEAIFSQTFQSLEDQLVQLAKTGEFSFSAIAQSASDILIRKGVRQSLGALTDALGFGDIDTPEERVSTAIKKAFTDGGDIAAKKIKNAFSGANLGTPRDLIADLDDAGLPRSAKDLEVPQDTINKITTAFDGSFAGFFVGLKDAFSSFLGGFGSVIKSILGGIIGVFSGGGGGGAGQTAAQIASVVGQSFVKSAANGLDFGVSATTSAATLPGGGVDNRLIAFRANDREEVSVRPKGSGGAGGINLNMTVVTNDADSFRKNQGQILNDGFAAAQRASRRFS